MSGQIKKEDVITNEAIDALEKVVALLREIIRLRNIAFSEGCKEQ
jgi:hypothetical protein